MTQDLLKQLDSALYLVADAVSDRYAVDWSEDNPCRPDVVLRPAGTSDVSAMLQLCHEADQAVVVQGGLTGLAGGATPQSGEWALSLERLNRIIELDAAAMTITVGAGTPLQTIQSAAEQVGLHLPLDLGARGSCLAGGLVSTNAGGNQVIQHGMARALVLGLVAVLADGTVIPARNKLLKNNAGFDLKQLFIGSEGTLGVVTEVTFRLFQSKPFRQTALCALDRFDGVVNLLQQASRQLESVGSFEVMWADYFEAATAVSGHKPFGTEPNSAFFVLLETSSGHETAAAEAMQHLLYELMEAGEIQDALIAQSGKEAATFWEIRDAVAELLPAMAPLANFDIGIPISSMDRFTQEVNAEIKATFKGCQLLIFGHIGDGNLHLIASTGRVQDKDPIYDLVYRKTGQFDGTITAEHGIGVLKKRWLSDCRSETEIELMRTLKQSLDPKGILNPGRVI